MEEVKTERNLSLQVTRTFPARQERVFEAFTRAEALIRWFGPTPEYAVEILELDPRPGGRYRFRLIHSDGQSFTVGGVYREVRRPVKLVFTWTWEGDEDLGTADSVVTVDFEAEGNSTHVVLTHERLATPESVAVHNEGWCGCFENLTGILK